MSCLPEATYAVYVDGELEPDETRGLEAHLVTCQRCRALVLALRDESALLGDVLQDRPAVAHDVLPKPSIEVPEPGLTLGMPLAIAGVTGLLAVIGFLIESRLPGGFDFANPLRLKGVYEMAFDAVFLLRDQAPGLVELAVSVAVVASISALGTFAVGQLSRRIGGPVALLLPLALLVVSGPARAVDQRFDQDTRIAEDEVIDESLVATGDVVHVDGTINGDLVVGAERVTVRGRVNGSVYAFVRDMEIHGVVTGPVHGAIEKLRIDGEVQGNVITGSEVVTIAPGGSVGRDIALFVEGARLEGRVGRDVVFWGDWLEVRGELGRDLEVISADTVLVATGARIAGDVSALLRDADAVDVEPGAVIGGSVDARRHNPMKEHYLAHYTEPGFYLFVLVSIAASFVFGLLLLWLVPNVFATDVPDTRSFFRTMGFGFLVLVVAPIAIVLTALTIIGIPVAVLGLFVFITAFFTADIAVGALIGSKLLPPTEPGLGAAGRSLAVGVAAIVVGQSIPFIGAAIGLVSLLLGLGLLYHWAERQRLARSG